MPRSADEWNVVWSSLSDDQRKAFLEVAAVNAATSSSPPVVVAAASPLVAAAAPPPERTAAMIYDMLKDGDQVRNLRADGDGDAAVAGRDRALVLLFMQVEARTTEPPVRYLVVERCLQGAPAFQAERNALALLDAAPISAEERYRQAQQVLAVDSRRRAVVRQHVAELQAPRQSAGETNAAFLQRVRLIYTGLKQLLFGDKLGDLAGCQPALPNGAMLFNALLPGTREAIEREGSRLFELALTAADRKKGEARLRRCSKRLS
jgi:hypothetical protein